MPGTPDGQRAAGWIFAACFHPRRRGVGRWISLTKFSKISPQDFSGQRLKALLVVMMMRELRS